MSVIDFKALAIAALLTATTFGCQAGTDLSETSEAAVQDREGSGLHITAATVKALDEGIHLRLDGQAQGDVITFDPARGQIDFSRISLVAGGQQAAMDRWLQEAAQQRGIDAQELEKSIFFVRLTPSAASLESWESPNPQQQGRCTDCCTEGMCCYAGYGCHYDTHSAQTICTCIVFECCGAS
ncbi:hypothetical protein [Pyxidicoccus trucidator]|uniref:hypothetical protein n=1 Tax=Pyxidicoccus trucidator TaxID=2709662 RepID=UPI0013DCBCC9|nr:hypothetical protein [Pyxidicoccus trucidator]